MSTYSVKYNIDAKPLGRGGAAKVYGCTRITDGERLAIKILSDKNDNGKVKRFRREIDAIVDIVNHGIDGVLPILDYDKDDLWYVMPLASSLRSIIDNYAKLQQTAIPVTTYRDEILQQNVEGFIMLADILEKIHTLGYVHRDIKPDNLYVWNGKYCIGDFGIVDLPTNTTLTKKHDRLGAWNTIAPEVLRDARNASNKSDVYSLAKSLWMGLSLNTSGFDGRYDYNAPSMSLHDMPHLENAYLLDIDTLLYDATQEDPALRPSMKEFAKLLMEWKKSQSNFNLCNKKEWGFIYKALFSGFPLPIVSISENAEIVRILHFFARYTRLNYTMMPRGGGLTLKDASVSPEVGCIYLDFGCTFVCKPKQLVIRGFSDDETWNYIFLELEELKPILTYGENEEELVEDTPAHYVDCTYSVYGVYDYDIGNKFPDGWKTVTRVCEGKFLIVAKSGFYNSITPTSDGRHSLFTESEFYDYISGIRNDVINTNGDENELAKVRGKYWSNPKQHSSFIINENIDKSVDIDVSSHLDELDFADLLDDSGSDKAKYYFTIDTIEWHSPFEPYKNSYLCKDGKIRKIENDDSQIFFAHDKSMALLMTKQMKQRLIDTFAKDIENPKFDAYVSVHCMMQDLPEHIFTFNELKQAIYSADDRKDNVVCIDDNGFVVVASDVDYHIYPISYSPFYAYKNNVGPYSNDVATFIVKDLRSLFLQYIKTSVEARHSEDNDCRDIKEIVRETKTLLESYKNGAKHCSI